MNLLRAGFIEEFHRLPELGAPDDGVVHEEKLLALDELRDGDLLHLGHLVPHVLALGHEGPGPGGGVFYEGPGEGLAAAVGEADGVGDAGVRDPRHVVHLRELAPLDLVPGHDLAVAVAHDLHIHPLVAGIGIAVVGPEKGADAHVLPRGGEGLPAFGGNFHNLLGAQLVGVLIAQLVVGEGLEGDAAALPALPDEHRQAAQAVPGGVDALGCEDEDGHGALDLLLGVTDAGDQVVLLVDEGGHQLRGVDLAGAHGHELVAVVGEVAVHQGLGVLDDAHGGDGVQPQVGAHQQGLGVRVADTADAGAAPEPGQILLELGAEGGVLNVVDLPVKAGSVPVIDGHAAPAGAQVGVVVRAEEHVQHHVPF